MINDKTIPELNPAEPTDLESAYRADQGGAEDVMLRTPAFTRTMLAEQYMQGVNVELAKSITDNKKNLSAILAEKQVSISPTALYSEFGQAIKNLEVDVPYTTTQDALLTLKQEITATNFIPQSENNYLVYLPTKQLLVGISKPNILSLYRVFVDENANIQTERVFRQEFETLALKTYIICAKSLRDSYLAIGTSDTGSDTVTNIFKIDEVGQVITEVVLTPEQQGYLGTQCICSIDDTCTMVGVADSFSPSNEGIITYGTVTRNLEGNFCINLKTGETYKHTINTQSIRVPEYWVTSSVVITNISLSVSGSQQGGVVGRISGSDMVFTDLDTAGGTAIVDIPEKQLVLLYEIEPRNNSHYNDPYPQRLNVYKLSYFEGGAVKLFSNYLPYPRIDLLRYSAYPTPPSYDYYPQVFKTDTSILVVPQAYFTCASFWFTYDTDAVRFPFIDKLLTGAYVYPRNMLLCIKNNNTVYTLYTDTGNKAYQAAFNVNTGIDTTLYYKEKTYSIV